MIQKLFQATALIKKALQGQPVSVIICAKNEASNLTKNLPAVLTQKYLTTYEVLVVNDNSTDESKYILEEFQKTFKHLQIAEVRRDELSVPGKKIPLSVGINSARHDTVLLTDADCVPASENWLKRMHEGYKHDTEIVLGYGAYQKSITGTTCFGDNLRYARSLNFYQKPAHGFNAKIHHHL